MFSVSRLHGYGGKAVYACHVQSTAAFALNFSKLRAIRQWAVKWWVNTWRRSLVKQKLALNLHLPLASDGVLDGGHPCCLQVIRAASSAHELPMNSFVCRRQCVTCPGNMPCSKSAARVCIESRNILVVVGKRFRFSSELLWERGSSHSVHIKDLGLSPPPKGGARCHCPPPLQTLRKK